MLEDEILEEWYDAEGNYCETGCYDAGGHYYAERDADRIDDFADRVKHMES